MLFLIVLVVATAAAALLRRGASFAVHARQGLAGAMVVAGLAHLAMPDPFVQHLPGWVPERYALIYTTGIVEVALGAALVWPVRLREVAGVALALYLLAVFPANVYVAVAGVDVDGQPGGVYPWLRLPFQLLFVWIALWSTNATSLLRTLAGESESSPRPVQARLTG